ncbi:hypothetical protein CR513_35392, partial [Mucuna pruriens]
MCKVDSIAYTGLVERERIFKFLHGLNFEYNPIRVQILGKEKLPFLFEVFFIVRSEETRRSVMLDKGNSNTGSAMVIRKDPIKRPTSKEKPLIKSSRGEYYTYCKRSRHTKDTCYKRYGKEKGGRLELLKSRVGYTTYNIQRKGGSYLEVELVIESLPFPTQDVQVQVQEVTPTQDVQVQVQEVTKPTLVLKQVQMSKLNVSILNNSIEEKVQLSEPEGTQTYGIDYEETFALVAKMNTVRVIISLAAHFGWNLQQFDIKNVFLHGDLEEKVYMEIPPGFYSHSEKNKSPRPWFGRFAQVMISLGYKQSQGDHTLFIKHSLDGKLTLLLVYVDDMIVTSDDEIEKLNLKEKLATQFEMKKLGKLKYFLGIEVAYSKQGIFISRRKYVFNLLKETGKLGYKTLRVPIEQNHRIGSEESPIIEKSQYQRLVGKLIYLSHTRPDIAYVVSVVNQFMYDPRERHPHAVERILQYLKASLGKGLLFRREGKLSMKIYTDVDYARSVVDRRSTSEYCMFLGGNLVTWRSKKQNVYNPPYSLATPIVLLVSKVNRGI